MESTLNFMLNNFRQSASALGDYQSLSKTELANGYCDADEAGNSRLREAYFSALIIRYWFKVSRLYLRSKSTKLDIEDIVNWVIDGLLLGFKYRAWREPSNKLYKDPDGPDKVFNRCIETIRCRYHSKCSLDKSKASYLTEDLDSLVSTDGEETTSFIDTISNSNDEFEEYTFYATIDQIAKKYFNNNDYFSGIIIDRIVYGNPVNSELKFSRRSLMEGLNNLPVNYADYLILKYNINKDELGKILNKMSSITNKKLYSMLDNSLFLFRNDKEMRELLCI